jgi:hypothetical protein
MAFDKTHPEWAAFAERLNGKIETRRRELEAQIGPDATNFIRGQISQLRELLEDAEAPPVGAITPRYGT